MEIVDRIKILHKQIRVFLGHLRNAISARKHHLLLLMFIAGFIVDNLTLPDASSVVSHAIVATYLFSAVVLLFVLQYREERSEGTPSGVSEMTPAWLPLALQFCVGALFSALFTFYMRSASLSGSWFFLLIFAIAAVGNELFRTRLARLEFQLATIFFVLYAYLIYAVPVALALLSPGIFYLSGAIAVLVALALALLLLSIAPKITRRALGGATISTALVLVVFNTFYIWNIIPPVPLVLREADIYHALTKDASGNFRAQREATAEGRFSWILPAQYSVNVGDSAFAFTAVFAPSQLKTPLVHEWQRRNETSGKWETKLSVEFPIVGGRVGGYRGYSEKTNIDEGEWRVVVRTGDGRNIGSKRFRVQPTTTRLTYTEIVL